MNRQSILSILGFVFCSVVVVVVVWIVGSAFIPTWPLQAACASAACIEAREWLTFGVTAAVVAGGLYQYWQAQRWRRAEWVAAATATFFADKHVMNALHMLDWNKRRLPLLLDTPETGRTHFEFKAILLRTALYSRSTIPKNEAGRERPFTEDELAVRDCFDRLLDQLERFEIFIENGLVDFAELRPYLTYWFELIGNPHQGRKTPELIRRLRSYINDYGFQRVQRLAKRFGHDISSPNEERDPWPTAPAEVLHDGANETPAGLSAERA
jgi:hypothetical protein